MTPRRHLGYAAGLALVLGATACGAAGEDPVARASAASSPSVSPSVAGPTAGRTTPASATTSSTPHSTTAPTTSAGRTLEITITGKKVTPAPQTIDLRVGESITLVVTADHDDEIHAHGFEVEGRLRAGTPSRVTVTGRRPGLYEVETHEPPLRLLMIAVR